MGRAPLFGPRFVRRDGEELRAIEVMPQYLKFSIPTFLLGAMYERLVNASDALEFFRVNWIGTFRKSRQ